MYDSDVLTDAGRAFQATGSARSSSVFRREVGTSSVDVDPERSRRRDSTEMWWRDEYLFVVSPDLQNGKDVSAPTCLTNSKLYERCSIHSTQCNTIRTKRSSYKKNVNFSL